MEFDLTTAQIVEDALYLHKIISENNPFKFLKERTHHVNWDDKRGMFAARAKDVKTAEEFYNLIEDMTQTTQCGHISPCPDFVPIIHGNDPFPADSPWRWYADDDETYERNIFWDGIKKATKPDEKKNGEDRPEPQVFDKELNKDTLYMRIPQMYDYYNNEEISAWIKKSVDSLSGYKNLVIDIRDNDGGGDGIWREFLAMIVCEDIITPLALGWRSGEHVRQYIRSVLGDDFDKRKEDFKKYLCDTGIVVDEVLLSDKFAPPILEREVIPMKEDSVLFQGKIAVIVNKKNFSSSEAFLVRVKHNNLAALVGQTTGGDGIGCTPAIFILPNSRLCVRYPVILGLNPDGTINDEYPIAPDVFCEVPSFETPLELYEDGGLSVLLADEAVNTAMNTFSLN